MNQSNYDPIEVVFLKSDIERMNEQKKHKTLLAYSKSEDSNKRSVAAMCGVNLEKLVHDEDINVLKTVARYSAEYSEKIAREFFASDNVELHTMAALSLASQNMLTDKEVENMEAPILLAMIKERYSLMQIARIHKVGEVKKAMVRELYRMSRYENLDVEDIRTELNSQPFVFGDYLYKMDVEIDPSEEDTEIDPYDEYLKKENSVKEESAEVEEEPSSDDEMSLDELLSKI